MKSTTFLQKPNETFNEAWNVIKTSSSNCPSSWFLEITSNLIVLQFLNTNDQDALDSAAGGKFLDKMPRGGLAIIESKSKVYYSRSRPNDSRVITNAPSSTSSSSNNSFEIQQMAALLEDKMNIRRAIEKAIIEKDATTPATVKAVEEVCVTCGSNHNFNNCPLTRNDFPVFHDNIHQFQQTAAVGNFVQRTLLFGKSKETTRLINQMFKTTKETKAATNETISIRIKTERQFQPNRQNNQGAVIKPHNTTTNESAPVYQSSYSTKFKCLKTDFETRQGKRSVLKMFKISQKFAKSNG
ncbi:hypothetical protein Tco_0257775 [Tanacetum coccineum]